MCKFTLELILIPCKRGFGLQYLEELLESQIEEVVDWSSDEVGSEPECHHVADEQNGLGEAIRYSVDGTAEQSWPADVLVLRRYIEQSTSVCMHMWVCVHRIVKSISLTNEYCQNYGIPPPHTHTHTHTYRILIFNT